VVSIPRSRVLRAAAPWGVPVALLLVAGEATAPAPAVPPLLLALALLALSWRSTPRVVALLAAAAWLTQATARIHAHLDAAGRAQPIQARLGPPLQRLEDRKAELVTIVQAAADRASRLPAVSSAVRGDAAAVARLFRELEAARHDRSESASPALRPALAVHAAGRVVAWSGRIGEPSVPPGIEGRRADVFVLEGTVSTTLVGLAPLTGSSDAGTFVTASLPLAARRNIRNEFLRDFDLLAAGADPSLEVRYVDARAAPEELESFPPLDPALEGREAVLRAPDGDALAVVRLSAPRRPQPSLELQTRYRRVLSLMVVLALSAWAGLGPVPARRWRWVAAFTAMRGALLYVGPPLPGPASPLLSPEVYASDALTRWLPPLAALLRSPLDLLLTSAWLAAVATVAASAAAEASPARPSLVRTLGAALAALPVLAGVFLLVGDAVVNSSIDLDTVPLVPGSLAHLVMHVALLLAVAAGAMLVVALFGLAGPWPHDLAGSLGWMALVVLPPFALLKLWPAALGAPPLLAALTLQAVAATTGAGAAAIRRWSARVGAGARAGLAIVGTAALAAVLHPTLVHYTESHARVQVERRYAKEVQAQPDVRQYVLEDAMRRIDALELLEEAPLGRRRPGLEELAFYAWSNTELALRGVSSAIEIQDAFGDQVSRFALNLASLSSPALPPNENWKVDLERVRLASTERAVLHARRLLAYHGAVHGAVHVMVADDFWNLPFLRGRGPYSELFRTRPQRDRPVAFLSWDQAGRSTFNSTERPAALPAAAAAGVGAAGFWTAMELDGRPHEAYVFGSERGIHALALPSLTPGMLAANLVEAVVALTLLAVLAVLVVVVVRTLLRRPTLSIPSLVRASSERFGRRLLAAFLAVAIGPVVVLQVLVHRFVSDRLSEQFVEQARERAEVARKVALDYMRFLRSEQGPGRPITDDPLVWIADTIGNDLDVFEQGRLLASSKRELYDAGLLPRRISGAVYREVILEGQPFYAREEKIGAFSYSVASVPLRLDEAAEPWILSLPLVLPQRDVQATVADIERRVRLASVVFFALAALLANSMARRISGPISSLTEAVRRIAQGDLDARVEPTSNDELRRLVEAVNQMAGDLERQRRDLERSNRLAAWAEMARQVAHEVKNPLTPIQLSAEHLRRVWRDRTVDFGATLETCTQAILKQVSTLRGIVTEFSAFARPPATILEPQDPAEVLCSVVRPYQAGLPEGVELTLDCPAGAGQVLADRRLLERAIVNLVENALQAVAGRGRIDVRLRPMDDGRVEVQVADSGPGLDPEIRDRIFEPFFSTKTAGSGLGLALVKKIAEDHGGGVRLESEQGAGTRAILWLPSAGPVRAETPSPSGEGGGPSPGAPEPSTRLG
jgi:signal transduction histidine kinase